MLYPRPAGRSLGGQDGPCSLAPTQGGVDFPSLPRFSLPVCSRLASLESDGRRDSRENLQNSLATPRCVSISGIPQMTAPSQTSLPDKGLTKGTLGEGGTFRHAGTQPLHLSLRKEMAGSLTHSGEASRGGNEGRPERGLERRSDRRESRRSPGRGWVGTGFRGLSDTPRHLPGK